MNQTPPPDNAAAMAMTAYTLGRALYTAALRGGVSETVRDRMMKPRPGDLVIEVTAFHTQLDPDGIGRLVSIQGTPEMPERYVVEPLHRPGTQQGWRNATFAAVPDQPSAERWAEGGEPS
ncbi:hypothetical protein [Streptomyces aidingensis]|uniref:Uncharacterized protein n=1 Tax=Streptomyces aidingensis TaxID=910347 RepID=A0A1I1PVY4_9ACTN|nr:hypothetical protein [Streptomyces aidingensis]SFD14064.1 hypothetical protein SAMN05421773_11092 [Streptomyces aidingensis]